MYKVNMFYTYKIVIIYKLLHYALVMTRNTLCKTLTVINGRKLIYRILLYLIIGKALFVYWSFLYNSLYFIVIINLYFSVTTLLHHTRSLRILSNYWIDKLYNNKYKLFCCVNSLLSIIKSINGQSFLRLLQ